MRHLSGVWLFVFFVAVAGTAAATATAAEVPQPFSIRVHQILRSTSFSHGELLAFDSGSSSSSSSSSSTSTTTINSSKTSSITTESNSVSTTEKEANEASIKYTTSLIHNSSDVAYYVNAYFGSHQTMVKLVIDTGSADLWAYSAKCTTDVCNASTVLSTSDSPTLVVNETDEFTITYGQGQVWGVGATDYVSLVGFNTSMGFGLIENTDKSFESFPVEGILGLPLRGIQSSGFPTFLSVLMDENLIPRPVFSIDFPGGSDNYHSEITFGGVNTKRFSGAIDFTSTVGGISQWVVPLEDCYVANKAMGFSNKLLIFDSGSTIMHLPPDDAVKIHVALASKNASTVITDGENYAIPCDTNTSLSLDINGHKWTISPENYIGGAYDNEGNCFTNFHGGSVNGSTSWVLGTSFLRGYYTVFDAESEQIGLANRGSGGKDYYNDASVAQTPSTTTQASATSTANLQSQETATTASMIDNTRSDCSTSTHSTTELNLSSLVTSITTASLTYSSPDSSTNSSSIPSSRLTGSSSSSPATSTTVSKSSSTSASSASASASGFVLRQWYLTCLFVYIFCVSFFILFI
ncbi:aspartic peptidase domain-containing protein [Lipomyces oligophaga]|uniref:aspartic peptidase domain-containing protein n=1 Tax=Lipomyces oligophaga TaxID=45792 RepID=UPI0034CD5FD1